MLYGLFSLQTNLFISLHYQSDVLWHNGTNYKQLLFSSDIWAGTSAMGICAFFYMWNLFGVWCSRDVWLITRGANDIVTTRERERPSVPDMSVFCHGPSALTDILYFYIGYPETYLV